MGLYFLDNGTPSEHFFFSWDTYSYYNDAEFLLAAVTKIHGKGIRVEVRKGENVPASFSRLANESRKRNINQKAEETNSEAMTITAEPTCCNNLVFH